MDIPQQSLSAAMTAKGEAHGAGWQDIWAVAGLKGLVIAPIEQLLARHCGHHAESRGTRKAMESAPISARRLTGS